MKVQFYIEELSGVPALEQIAVQLLSHMLGKYNGNIVKAAKATGISRNKAYRLIRQYEIQSSWGSWGFLPQLTQEEIDARHFLKSAQGQ